MHGFACNISFVFSETKFLSQPAMKGDYAFISVFNSFSWKDNAEATAVLRMIEEAVELGYQQKALQRSPHLVLLSDAFYRSHLLIPLAKWVSHSRTFFLPK
jgi:hypothetical protein